jgi:hypothetical protein
MAEDAPARQKPANDEAQKARQKLVTDRLKARDEQNKEYYERMASCQPTPTQEENDMFKLGGAINDDKEDDGSEAEDEHITRIMAGKVPGGNPYDVRALEPSDQPRKRGRPRKAESA